MAERKEITTQLKLFESAELIEKCQRNLILTPPGNEPVDPPLHVARQAIQSLCPDIIPTTISSLSPTPPAPVRRRSASLPKSSALPRLPSSHSGELAVQASTGTSQLHTVAAPVHAQAYEELASQCLILKSKLNVELYLKQQHLHQMGSLHKHNILGTGLAAEIQHLVSLSSRFLNDSQVHVN